MAYSHSRLRKTLALVRIVTGIVFVSVGAYKVTSLDFAKLMFPDFLQDAIQGAAVSWVRPILEWIVSYGPARVAVMIGFLELFIGIALVLGLTVRPAALLGMLYSIGLFLATWNPAPEAPSMLQSAEHQFRNLFPFFVFLLLGVGHAGETWGLGALYHHHRLQKLERERARQKTIETAEPEEEKEPGSFEDFVEREERAARALEHDSHEPELHDMPEA